MSDTPFILFEPVARKYEFSFDDNQKSFNIKVLKQDLESLRTIPNINTVLNRIDERFNFKLPWDIHSDNYHGYDNCLVLEKTDQKFVCFKGIVPKDNGKALACSMSELFELLHYQPESKRPQDNQPEQEMFLQTDCSVEQRIYGATMEAQLSFNFSKWIYLLEEDKKDLLNEKIHLSMNLLYAHLYNKEPSQGNSGMSEHAFLLEPPFGIYTCQFGIDGEEESKFNINRHRGYRTFCHNLDAWPQQFILLAGFAKICEAYRNQ